MESQFNLAYLYRTGSSDSVPMPDNGTAGKVGLRKKKGSTPVRRRSQKVHAVDMHKALALYLQAAEQGHQMVIVAFLHTFRCLLYISVVFD